MSLPNPLPDNPQRWDGWRSYNSANLYERLGLSIDSNASTEQIEEHTRRLLVWWQKKLPLKNQPSNPLSQILRTGLDEAPVYLAEARTILLDPVARRNHDIELRSLAITAATLEFKKLIAFTLTGKRLVPADEQRLVEAGMSLGLRQEEAAAVVDAEVKRTGSVRETAAAAPTDPGPAASVQSSAPESSTPRDPFSEFRRLLRMSRLSVDGDDMTDDQRDAMCNLGESLGLTGGQAEDLIDEYLEDVATMPMQMTQPKVVPGIRVAPPPQPAPQRAAAATPPKPAAPPAKPLSPAAPGQGKAKISTITPLMRTQEREKHPNFANSIGAEMFLVTSGSFTMGSVSQDAQPNEQPMTLTFIERFYISRFPITNAQYERFEAAHAAKRAPWADASHPVVYVSAIEAERFCEWLGRVERKRYRLPTEAEWEYAARGVDNRIYPWGEHLDGGHYGNFADVRSSFPWKEPRIDDGWAQTSPVGAFPRGVSPFGIEDMGGNVFEWCLDGFAPYKSKEIANPRGPREGGKRIYRGGSWKSRAASLRASARNFNSPDYSSNDVGFRIVCECD